MIRSWFGGHVRSSSQSLSTLDEAQALEDAMHAASHIMNDDMETAEAELSAGNSSFHKLGKGLVSFLKAVLGFEKEIMAEAQERLAEAELQAYENYRHVLRTPSSARSMIYSPGTEFLLVQAQVQIMSAVIGVLTESVTESIKGFYKLRKAYLTLDAIQEEEKKYLASLESSDGKPVTLESATVDSPETPSTEPSGSTSSSNLATQQDVSTTVSEGKNEFFDTAESSDQLNGVKTPPAEKPLDEALGLTSLENSEKPSPPIRRLSSNIQEGPDMEIFGANFVDSFIHSSSSCFYGVILILISLLPPTFSTLSKIVGFKGDRKKGIALLWQASKFGNLNGAFAGLMLLGYYNGFVGFCDILPTSGSGVYPRQRCVTLLETFRKRYPKSSLWMLEECRMLSQEKKLREADKALSAIPESKLKQVRALQAFEASMNNMFLHRYENCSEAFQRMVTLNNWSHGLYFYIAGCAHVERYRELLPTDPEKAREQAKLAEDLLKKVTLHTGKKRIMARQLPFDVFVNRKIEKWEQRAATHKVDFVDAVGVSPIEEMIYFWNGFKRMGAEDLEVSFEKLAWSRSSGKIPWGEDSADEHAVHALLQAAVLRNLGRNTEAKELLEKEVLSLDRLELKGGVKDNWACPVAHYEMGVNHWVEYGLSGEEKDLIESQTWLDKAATWEAYDMDARVGMRVKTGLETVKRTRETVFA